MKVAKWFGALLACAFYGHQDGKRIALPWRGGEFRVIIRCKRCGCTYRNKKP